MKHYTLCLYISLLFTDATAFSSAYYGQGSGAIVLDNVACTGLEEKLVDCPYDSHTADCYHYDDASVRCSTTTRTLPQFNTSIYIRADTIITEDCSRKKDT